MSTETQQDDEPEWEVSIESWRPDDEPGESEWRHYVVQAPDEHVRQSRTVSNSPSDDGRDESTAKDRAIDKATGVGFESIVGFGDVYRVYEVTGPYDPDE